MENHNGKSAQLIFKLSTHKAKQNKANQTKQFILNMKYEFGFCSRVDRGVVAVAVTAVVVVGVACNMRTIEQLRKL